MKKALSAMLLFLLFPGRPCLASSQGISEHFQVYASNRTIADELARLLEKAFVSDLKLWYPGEAAPVWESRCEAYIHDNSEEFAAATHLSARTPGYASINWDGNRVQSRALDLRLDYARARTAVVPHEVLHFINAEKFGVSHYLPHWADEGMAMLSEPEEQITLHLRVLALGQAGGYSSASRVLGASRYPDADQLGAFYSASAGLVRYLAEEIGTHAQFVKFLRLAMDASSKGYVEPLRLVYRLSLSELEAGFIRFQGRLNRAVPLSSSWSRLLNVAPIYF